MLLPSDVARLVLGYLQEEGLSATSQTFIQESPNLKEYADHTTGDGTIPACVFSLFGKGLTTILNEYVAAKTRESQYEIPVMMNSLWKKLDFTLNQIKSMQNSPAISAFQRTRTRVGLANIARQRALTVASTGGGVCSTVSETSSIISPAHVSSSLISHSTPVSYTAPLTRLNSGSETQLQIQDGGRLLNTPKDSSVHIVVSEQRLNPGPMSPGRRKWDTPRKRSAAVGGSVCPGRTGPTANSTNTEQQQPEEVIDGNFPQLVIQNARDKILGDRTLQEKLAENINKILANEPVPIPSKTPSATVEPDQSIDEILGLQGEIHMSDDAIHDILEQTESDPAFQALFDLFDCNKSRVTDGGPEDGDISSSPEESDAAGPSSTVELLKSNDQAMTPTDSSVRDATATAAKTKVGHDCRVVRKNAATTLLKKTFLSSSSRGSRVESCSPRLLVTPGVSSATGNSSKKRRPTSLNSSAILTPMDIDQPLNTPPPPTDEMDTSAPATEDCTSSTAVTGSTVEGRPEVQQAQDSTEEPSTTASPSAPPVDNTNPADAAVTCGQGDSGQTGTESLSAQSCSPAAHNSPAPSSAPVDMTPHIPSIPCKATTDSGNIVSLKIIISDNQENNSTDTVLNQAISSISGDKIPTIYLSSPAKSPGPVSCPNTPKSNMDEVAQAVSCLQNSEIFASPLTGKTGALIASPLTGTSQTQQSFILQLPMNSTPTPTLQGVGAAPSYILVTDSDVQTRQVLLPAGVPQGQSLPINQFGGTTQSGCPSFSNASTLIIPSPVKPVMLPVSVMGQSTVGNVQMMPNQLVAIPNPVSLQQTETITPSTVAPKQSTASAGTEEALAGKVTPPTSAERTCEQDTSKSLNHRRILCFDPSAEGQPQTANTAPPQNKTAPAPATTASPSPSDQQPQKGKSVPGSRTKPAILAGNKPKRRIEITRCPENPQPTGVFVKEVEKPTPSQPQQKDSIKKKPRKQHHSIYNQEPQSTTNSDADYPKSDDAKKSEKEKGSKTIDRKHSLGNNEGRPKTSDLHTSAKTTSDSAKKGTRNDKGESSRRDAVEKTPTKPREGRTEKKSQEMPNVTANKENEMKVGAQEQQQQSTPTSPSPRDFSPSATSQLTSPQSKGSKAQSKTSSLAKQAAEMLQDIQGLNSPSTPGKRPGAGTLEPSLPRTPCTGHNQGQITDSPRTPSLQNSAKDKEGTPKRLMPPNTPDVPTCSPASEAGSESSINMAAHTLMILSRAAIARTGTPLKDSLRQEEAAEKSPSSLKNSKKRKQSSASDSSPAKKEPKRSPSRKKDRERKRLVDCFPHDLDVDKFLSSLHYDE